MSETRSTKIDIIIQEWKDKFDAGTLSSGDVENMLLTLSSLNAEADKYYFSSKSRLQMISNLTNMNGRGNVSR